jgi:hypothetical protein
MKQLLLAAFCCILTMVIGCAPSTPVKEEARVLPTFHFEPPSKTPVDSGSVAFAVVNPQFPDSWKTFLTVYPFDKFSKNMATDFEAIVSARGFRMRGPFRTFDELTFPDKSQSDLILTPKIEIDLEGVGQTATSKDIFGSISYQWKGTVNLGGRITLNLNESLSNERMWTKSIELPSRSMPYTSKKYSQPVVWGGIPDQELSNLIAGALQDYYTLTMDKVWTYLDPKEMALVKQQAQTLKEKKRY